eukprot:1933799-Prymnesium_polylepis.1
MLEAQLARLKARRTVFGATTRFNELVIERGRWSLERVEAIIFIGFVHEKRARQIHRAFLARYGPSVAHVPLVVFIASRGFVDVTAGMSAELRSRRGRPTGLWKRRGGRNGSGGRVSESKM